MSKASALAEIDIAYISSYMFQVSSLVHSYAGYISSHILNIFIGSKWYLIHLWYITSVVYSSFISTKSYRMCFKPYIKPVCWLAQCDIWYISSHYIASKCLICLFWMVHLKWYFKHRHWLSVKSDTFVVSDTL